MTEIDMETIIRTAAKNAGIKCERFDPTDGQWLISLPQALRTATYFTKRMLYSIAANNVAHIAIRMKLFKDKGMFGKLTGAFNEQGYKLDPIEITKTEKTFRVIKIEKE